MSSLYDFCVVYVVEVDRVIEAGSDPENQGPIYVCPCEYVVLEAKPNPAGASFPDGEPTWTLEEQPEGADAQLLPSGDMAVLDELTELGDYVVKARCGSVDEGDEITVIVGGNPPGRWRDWLPDWNCPPENQAFRRDECDNWISVYCDSENYLNETAYSWWFNKDTPTPRQTEVGCCVWNGGINLFRYWYSYPGPELYLRTEHWTCDPLKGCLADFQGCPWHWCYRYVSFHCWHGVPIVLWKRKAVGDTCPCTVDFPRPEDDEHCPCTLCPACSHRGWPD